MQASMLGVIHPLVFFPMYEKLKISFMNNYDISKPEERPM